MNIIIFEDGLHDNFYPLSMTRPLWDLRSGLYTFRERLESFAENEPRLSGCGLCYFTREYLVPYFREKYPKIRINDYSVFEKGGEIIFVNAVKYACAADFAIEKNSVVVRDGSPVVARIDGAPLGKPGPSIAGMLMSAGLRQLDHHEAYVRPEEGRKADYIWELVDWNADIIRQDTHIAGRTGNGDSRKDVTIIGDRSQVYIEDGVVFEPYTVIDASEGPVVVGEKSRITSFTRIEGPCAIGSGCTLLGAKIRSGSSFGPCCRIGGEVEESIFQGYSNKYHDGFIGHSYIGEWVNMGALTTNSDLKNNYTNVKVYVSGTRKQTSLKKVGCFMGDFVKTSIGTLINTGTSIGAGSMLVHAGNLTPYHIPPFSWYMNSAIHRFAGLDDFIATNRMAMSRRNVDVTENFITLINTLYTMTSPEQGQA